MDTGCGKKKNNNFVKFENNEKHTIKSKNGTASIKIKLINQTDEDSENDTEEMEEEEKDESGEETNTEELTDCHTDTEEEEGEEEMSRLRRSTRLKRQPSRYGDCVYLTYEQAITGPDKEN
jgi:hypothetical protein